MAHLSGFGLENFRVFKDYTWFDFAPITLFVGPNSSGKSSVIKALLWLQDNYSKGLIPFDEEALWHNYKELVTYSGKNHNLQNDGSIIPYNSINQEVRFSLPYDGYPISFTSEDLYWDISYQIGEKGLLPGTATKLYTAKNDLFISDIGKNNGYLDTHLLKKLLTSKNRKAERIVAERYRNISNLEEIGYDGAYDTTYYDASHDRLIDELNSIALDVVQTSLGNNAPWPGNIQLLYKLLKKVSTEKATIITQLTNDVLDLQALRPAFSNWAQFVYVPSIKGLPKRYLKFDDDIEVLNRVFAHLKSNREEEHDTINRFINKWEREFGFKAPIKWIKDIDLGLTKVQVGNSYLNDLGFGISQLVAVLLANYAFTPLEDPYLLLLEEPEANLHPAFQSKLADMFVDSEKTLGHQFIIETHSEYLIRKLQYLTAKGEIKPETTAIYYFHDPNNVPAGEKQVKKINILEDGGLSDDFGPGFYDEAAHWELELLRLKRNKGRQN